MCVGAQSNSEWQSARSSQTRVGDPTGRSGSGVSKTKQSLLHTFFPWWSSRLHAASQVTFMVKTSARTTLRLAPLDLNPAIAFSRYQNHQPTNAMEQPLPGLALSTVNSSQPYIAPHPTNNKQPAIYNITINYNIYIIYIIIYNILYNYIII